MDESIRMDRTFSSDEEEELKFSESEDDHQTQRRKPYRQGSVLSTLAKRDSKASILLDSLNSRRKSSVITVKRSTLSTVHPPTPPSSDAESSEEEDKEDLADGSSSSPDMPSEYWQVQKLIKFIKAGNATATIIALSSLRDYDLTDEVIQKGIKESGGVEVLLNILETDEWTSKRAALFALKDIAYKPALCRTIFNMRVT